MNKKIKHCVPYGAPSFNYYDLFSIIKSESNLKRKIDAQIEKLKKQKMEPELMIEYLNSLVDIYVEALNGKLEKKHFETCLYINNLFTRRTMDERTFDTVIEELDKQIEDAKADREFIKKIYDSFNPLKKGKLNLDTITVQWDKEDD